MLTSGHTPVPNAQQAFRSANKKLFRIVTRDRKDGYRFLVGHSFQLKRVDLTFPQIAKADSLEHVLANEWRYVTTELPRLMPHDLDRKERLLWLHAHFTQWHLQRTGMSGEKPGDATLHHGSSADTVVGAGGEDTDHEPALSLFTDHDDDSNHRAGRSDDDHSVRLPAAPPNALARTISGGLAEGSPRTRARKRISPGTW